MSTIFQIKYLIKKPKLSNFNTREPIRLNQRVCVNNKNAQQGYFIQGYTPIISINYLPSIFDIFKREMIFVQPFCNSFLSHTQMIFLFSLFFFLSSLFLPIRREKNKVVTKVVLKWMSKYHYSFQNLSKTIKVVSSSVWQT